MRPSDDFGRTFERVAVYMLGILIESILGFTYASIAGAVFAGPRGSLIAGILGGLLGGCFAWWLISENSAHDRL
jgi:membrane associated rhomboid family serine protease